MSFCGGGGPSINFSPFHRRCGPLYNSAYLSIEKYSTVQSCQTDSIVTRQFAHNHFSLSLNLLRNYRNTLLRVSVDLSGLNINLFFTKKMYKMRILFFVCISFLMEFLEKGKKRKKDQCQFELSNCRKSSGE